MPTQLWTKETKDTHWKITCSTNSVGKTRYSPAGERESFASLAQPKMNKILYLKTPKWLKMPEESVKNTLHNIGAGKNFLNRTSVGQELLPSVSRWDSTKLKSWYKRRLSAENTDPHRMAAERGSRPELEEANTKKVKLLPNKWAQKLSKQKK